MADGSASVSGLKPRVKSSRPLVSRPLVSETAGGETFVARL